MLELLPNERVCAPVPRLIVEFSARARLLILSEYPVVSPVLNVPPFRISGDKLDMRSVPPNTIAPLLRVVVPE